MREAYLRLEDHGVGILGRALAGNEGRRLLGVRRLVVGSAELSLEKGDGAAEAGDGGGIGFPRLVAGRELGPGALGGGALLHGGEDGVAMLLIAGDGAGEGGMHAGHGCGGW